MRIASKLLLGTHDFRNFCKMDVGNGVVEFTRNILDVQINTCTDNDSLDGRTVIKLKNLVLNSLFRRILDV